MTRRRDSYENVTSSRVAAVEDRSVETASPGRKPPGLDDEEQISAGCPTHSELAGTASRQWTFPFGTGLVEVRWTEGSEEKESGVSQRMRDEMSDLEDRLRIVEERLQRQGRVIVFCLAAIVLLMVLVLIPGLAGLLRLVVLSIAALFAVVVLVSGTIVGLEWLNSNDTRRKRSDS